MRVKKYTASSMPEAMKKVRAELGSDAVILNSRTIQSGGFLGLFKKNSIEVIAAVDPDATAVPKQVPIEKAGKEPFGKTTFKSGLEQEPDKSSEKNELLQELAALKELVRKTGPENKMAVALPDPVNSQITKLANQELDQAILDDLAAKLLERWYLNGAVGDNRAVNEWCREAITEKLSNYSFGGLSFKKKFINVVGPTGVGKTTTLAKMAADSVLKHNKKVAFITTDTYRIAAIEQLKTYAKILDVPIEVCYNLDDFKNAAEKFADYEHIFIDTVGRNFRNRKYVEDLKNVIHFDKEMETFLVMALTAKQRDMEEIYRQFSLLSIDRFIFTKLDETSVHGSMMNMIVKYSAGAAYLTNGQDVPDDLLEASPELIAKTILGVNAYE